MSGPNSEDWTDDDWEDFAANGFPSDDTIAGEEISDAQTAEWFGEDE